MGANLCTLLRCPLSKQSSKSRDTRARTGSSCKEFIKTKSMKKYNRRSANMNLKRKKEMDGAEKKIPKATKLMTLEDWLLASPPDYKKRGELCPFKQSAKKKKVHPCSCQCRGSQCRGSSLRKAKDSLSLERLMLMNHCEKSEAILSTCSSSVSAKSRKRVRFKLPPVLIVYTPDEPCCKEASFSSTEEDPYNSDDSFPSPERLNSFDIADEPYANCRLAVDTLPHVFVSSRYLKQEYSCNSYRHRLL